MPTFRARKGQGMGMNPLPSNVRISQEFGAFPGGYNPPGGHTGRDYASNLGTDVVAIADGRVVWADWAHKMPGGPFDYHLRWLYDKNFPGILVIIEHDDCLSSPAHLNATHLNVGDRVKKGQIIGQSGNTGTATTGPHVHQEIIRKPFNWGTPTYGRVHPGPYTTEPYRITSGAKSTASWDNTPKAGDPWLPGSTREPQTGGVALDASLPKRFTWHITSDVDPGKPQPSFDGVSNYLKNAKYCPHIMWDPFTGRIVQYYPATVGSRALAAWNEDGAVHVQIEVLFSRGAIRQGKQYWTLGETPLMGFERLIQWADSLGVPRTWPMGTPPPIGTSGTRNVNVWNTKAGHYGHSQVPNNDHTDPGIFPDITKVSRQVGAATAITDTSSGTWDIQELLNMSQAQFDRDKKKAGTAAWYLVNGRDHAAQINTRTTLIERLVRGIPASVLGAKVKRKGKDAGTEATLAEAVAWERFNNAKDDQILAKLENIDSRLSALEGK